MERTGPSHEFKGRVAGAETKVRELAERIDAFFVALAEPPPPPPWRSKGSSEHADPVHAQEIERLEQLIHSSQEHAESAETRATEAEQELQDELDQVNALRATLREKSVVSGVDPATFQELEREFETTRLELDELRRSHVKALEQLSEMSRGPSTNSVSEESVARVVKAEQSLQNMQLHMQEHLLEQEETLRSRDEMRNSNKRLRDELRVAQQKRDKYKEAAEDADANEGQVAKLRTKVERRDKELKDLRAELKILQRTLATQEKREEHLRRHLKPR